MEPITFTNAYYVKLGRGGEYVDSSFSEGRIRVGWKGQTLDDIHNWQEDKIWKDIKREREEQGLPLNKSAITNDVRMLMKIAQSTPEDIWITFHDSHLWWCRVDDTLMDKDDNSKFRRVLGKWSMCDIKNKPLIINEISGKLSKIQGFRGTICSLGQEEVEALKRLLNDKPSEAFKEINNARTDLIKKVESGLSPLHWKDFEILVDLIFRNMGWRRVSMVGESMEYADLILQEPVTGNLHLVQVKSDATLADFQDYAQRFFEGSFKKLYFVVHNSREKWADAPAYKNVELILQERLAEMVVDSGLVNWLLKKIR